MLWCPFHKWVDSGLKLNLPRIKIFSAFGLKPWSYESKFYVIFTLTKYQKEKLMHMCRGGGEQKHGEEALRDLKRLNFNWKLYWRLKS